MDHRAPLSALFALLVAGLLSAISPRASAGESLLEIPQARFARTRSQKAVRALEGLMQRRLPARVASKVQRAAKRVVPGKARDWVARQWQRLRGPDIYSITEKGMQALVDHPGFEDGVPARVPALDPQRRAMDRITLVPLAWLPGGEQVKTRGAVYVEDGVRLQGTAENPVRLEAQDGFLIIRNGSVLGPGATVKGCGSLKCDVKQATVRLDGGRLTGIRVSDADLRLKGELNLSPTDRNIGLAIDGTRTSGRPSLTITSSDPLALQLDKRGKVSFSAVASGPLGTRGYPSVTVGPGKQGHPRLTFRETSGLLETLKHLRTTGRRSARVEIEITPRAP